MTQTSYFAAIDLGTSRIAAATARVAADGSIVTAPFPLGRKSDSVATVVFVGDDGELTFGDAAERRGVTQPDRLIREFKRSVGDEVPLVVGGRSLPAEQLYALTVAEIVRMITEREGSAPDAIALTHPTAWGDHRIELIRTALAQVGIDDVELITEPEAAARHYEAARPLEIGGTLAVYDLGGGTFDCVVLRKEIDGSFDIIGEPVGIDNLGGADFDDAVMRHVIDASGLDVAAVPVDDPDTRLAFSQLRRECVDAKEALSFDSETAIPVLVPPHRASVRLTRSEFEDMITPSIERTVDALDEALESASLEPEQLESILLIGGSSRIPRVTQLLSDRFDRPIAIDADPKAAIALGAARTALVSTHDRLLAPAAGTAVALTGDTVTDVALVSTDATAPLAITRPSLARKSSPILLAGAAATIAAAIVFASTISAGSNTPFSTAAPTTSPSATAPATPAPEAPPVAAPPAAEPEAVVDAPSEPVAQNNPRRSATLKAATPPAQPEAARPTARPTSPPTSASSSTTPAAPSTTTPTDPAGRTGTDHPARRTGADHPARRTGAHHPARRTGAHHPARRTGADHPARRTGAHHPARRTGAHHPARRTRAHHPARRTGAHHPARRTDPHRLAGAGVGSDMRTRTQSGTLVAPLEDLHIWGRQTRPTLEALADAGSGARTVIVGNAGSGKSTVLRALRRLLEDRGVPCSILTNATDVAQVPRAHVLMVDDLHTLSADRVEAVAQRSEDEDAGLIVSIRPLAHSDTVGAIVRVLERSRPPVVLGHVSRSDVLTFLEESDGSVPDACIDHILRITGGVTWLVSEALAAHDERDCADDDTHSALTAVLEERIAHRLDTIEPILREQIEVLCLAAPGHVPSRSHTSEDSAGFVLQGYAEGLLARSGQPVPLVRSTVRTTIPMHRLMDASQELLESLAHSIASGDFTYREWGGLLHDPHVGDALARHADGLLETNPLRAAELYRAAVECGVDRRAIAGRRAQAAWAAGDLDQAASLVEFAIAAGDGFDTGSIADTAAATWSARGMLETSSATYRALPPTRAESVTRATLAHVGVGALDRLSPAAAAPAEAGDHDGSPSESVAPTTLGVAMDLLRRGLHATLAATDEARSVADLVRAADVYTSSGTSAPIPELPAVVAVVAAISSGDLATAQSTIDAAIKGGHGGSWARPRLLLWRSWIAVQRARPAEARAALTSVLATAPALSPRDELLAMAVRVAIARRYDNAAGLAAVWRDARDSLVRVDPDLYTLLPLSELIADGARVGDSELIERHLAKALSIVAALGSPPLWSNHLHWAGVQRSMLLNEPSMLVPHARALVNAAPRSPVAATMSRSGDVWTSVLAGTVDADAVETAAHDLASIGLLWDAARLAGRAAARSTDRKVSARLLACARNIHPQGDRWSRAPIEHPRRHRDGAPDRGAGSQGVGIAERA